MNLHAVLKRNIDGMGANQYAWKLTVFDGAQEVRSNLTYDHTPTREIPFADQIRGRLADLGYAAVDFELVRAGDEYYINDVHPLA